MTADGVDALTVEVVTTDVLDGFPTVEGMSLCQFLSSFFASLCSRSLTHTRSSPNVTLPSLGIVGVSSPLFCTATGSVVVAGLLDAFSCNFFSL